MTIIYVPATDNLTQKKYIYKCASQILISLFRSAFQYLKVLQKAYDMLDILEVVLLSHRAIKPQPKW